MRQRSVIGIESSLFKSDRVEDSKIAKEEKGKKNGSKLTKTR